MTKSEYDRKLDLIHDERQFLRDLLGWNPFDDVMIEQKKTELKKEYQLSNV